MDVAHPMTTWIDFSCALFGAEGGLVANAPHIPVHLGALSHAVTYQLNYYKGDLKEGDVIMTNHPAAGGSHLPGKYILDTIVFILMMNKNRYHNHHSCF